MRAQTTNTSIGSGTRGGWQSAARLRERGEHEARSGRVAGSQALQAVHLRDAPRGLVARQQADQLRVRLLALCARGRARPSARPINPPAPAASRGKPECFSAL